MHGALIGSVVASAFKLLPASSKDFPLIRESNVIPNEAVVVAAAARAVKRSREEQSHSGGLTFGETLIRACKEASLQYKRPAQIFLGQGAILRAIPFGLAAVTEEEAQALVWTASRALMDSPEDALNAQTVAGFLFQLKCRIPKGKASQWIAKENPVLDGTLRALRYINPRAVPQFGTVPVAVSSFLESWCFEDAVRSAVFLGRRDAAAVTLAGAFAWVYYTYQALQGPNWKYGQGDPAMQAVREKAFARLPEEFSIMADDYHDEVCWARMGTYDRSGFCVPILNPAETKAFRERDAKKQDPGPAEKVYGGKAYSLEYIKSRENQPLEDRPGGRTASYDASMKQWRMRIQLDQQRVWFLSVFVRADGTFSKFSLDQELASDSHYEFTDESGVRKRLYQPGDEQKYLAEVMIDYVKQHGGAALMCAILPFVTAQFHYD